MGARFLDVVDAALTLLTDRVDVLDRLRGELALLCLLHHALLLDAELLQLKLCTAETFLHLLEHLCAQLLCELRLDGDRHLD